MKKGHTGLANLGNTCFMNACIQVLNHTEELIAIQKRYEKHIRPDTIESALLREYTELRNIMTTNTGVVTPGKFVYFVHTIAQEKGRELFSGWAQNDMPEFLLFMVECMHASISRGLSIAISGKAQHTTDELAIQCYTMVKDIYAKEYSEIRELFYGIYVSEIWSMDGKTRHSSKPEPFFILDMPIPRRSNSGKPATLLDCFDLFTGTETVHGENAWYNERTGQKEDIRKRITFWNFPNVIVISLKRFSGDGRSKMGDLVDFPMDTLDLSKYVSGYNPDSFVYELYAVCNHMGGVHGGHYTAFANNSKSGEWFHYNDTTVEHVPDRQTIVSPTAYCLFYRKKNG
jgi:ubiquitin C-terminal hydrolase